MSTGISDEETVNWTKASTGLVVTKIGLSQSIIKTWKTHLYSWDKEERSHLHDFFKDAEEGRITFKWGKDKKNKRKGFWTIDCVCQSGMCQKILDRLLNLHVNPKSQHIVWNPYEKPNKRNKLVQCKLNRQDKYAPSDPEEEECTVCREKNCPFELNRKGIALSKNQADDDVDKYYWKIANMFMFHGRERNSIENTRPEDTDSALIFKMMKNCKLFTFDNEDESENEDDNVDKDDTNEQKTEHYDPVVPLVYKEDENGKKDDDEFKGVDDNDDDESKNEADDETYNELLEVRNFLMHTSDNRLSDEALGECFTRMKTILQAKKFSKDTFCKKAVEELTQLESMVIIMTSLTSRDANIVKQAFGEQRSALKYDISLKGNLKSDHVLEGLLHISTKTYEKYRVKITAWELITGAFIAGSPGAILGAAVGGLIGKLTKK